MNTAMKLLLQLGVKMNEATDGTDGGSGGTGGEEVSNTDFNPTPHNQTSGLYDDDRAEEEGVNDDPTLGSGGSGTDEDDADADDADAEESGDQTEEDGEEESGETKYYFEGQEIEIETDPETAALLTGAGFDVDALNAEIYSEKGLTQETKEKLYEAFGKPTVDLHLKSLEQYNQSVLRSQEANEISFSHKQSVMANRATEGKLDDVLSWANDSLTPEEYKKYQANVNSDNLELAEMSLQNLTMRYKAAQAPGQAQARKDSRPNLVGGVSQAQGVDSANVGLSAMEYQKLFEPSADFPQGEYYTNPKKYDELRNLGKSRGR